MVHLASPGMLDQVINCFLRICWRKSQKMNLDNFLFLVCLGMNTNNYQDGQSILWWWIQHLQVCWSRSSTASFESVEGNLRKWTFYFWYALVWTQITMRLARLSCDGESSVSRYAEVGCQLLPWKSLNEIKRNELDNFFSLECLGIN